MSSRGRFGSTLLQADDYGWPALGYVVENAWLGNALIQALYRQARVEVRSPAKVLAALPPGGRLQPALEGDADTVMRRRCCWWRMGPVRDCAINWAWR